ncbi:hypothetical protein BDV23DRAFT_171622 [Aspergillus alliaceus]|uniref:Uncharacterized protein n=1 Tax=Petromyces alliaceus TaxID=209559 RepID=A0A5N7CBA6_PETAA|nr:uncharacterized protein BDW43DRAFT_301793 [Aspergillus alliaceus]KAB8231342.1 hypothetical protein BDW43DRAFT_301793 [Aspergillus alliaceus]KAE8391440.1 hypothetical protein BDV23DRAFT_171622 [Aspergillus alliaceus]
MRFFGGIIGSFIVCSSVASAFCHSSISCAVGGDKVCNNVCVRQGNPNGGRCLPRDGCPGDDICACYPQSKRSDEVIDGDDALRKVLDDYQVLGDFENIKARDDVEKRSICCNFPQPFGGLCCEDHCSYIGKPGGQCSSEGVCKCN